MSSILYYGRCFINDKQSNVQISIEESPTNEEGNYLLQLDNFQLKSKKGLILIKFDSIEDDSTVPILLLLSKILFIKQNEKSIAEFIEMEINYVHISEIFLWNIEQIKMKMDFISAKQFCSIIEENLLKIPDRPRNLLVFVNPNSGKNTSHLLYYENILPLFEQSNIHVKTILTERQNHARDYLLENSYDEYDGIICVGGDGIFSEISSSILLKTLEENHQDINDENIELIQPKIRLGIIPCGSTDALVYNTTGHHHPITSALQIITGQSILIDICTVYNENGYVCLMSTTLSYGYLADIIEQSDQWRKLGPSRYNLSGIIQYLRNKSYHVHLKINQINEKYLSKIVSGQSYSSNIEFEGHYQLINCLNVACRCSQSKYGMSPSVTYNDGSFDVILLKHSSRMNSLRFLLDVANDATDIQHLPNVQRYRAKTIEITPKGNEIGHWSCDGELIQGKFIQIHSHQQILPLFATGIHFQEIQLINQSN